VDAVNNRLDEMTQRLNKVEARGVHEIFELDGYTFTSFAEFAQVVKDEQIPSSGMFWDLFSILVNMRPKGLTGKERADEQYSSEQIQTSIFENSLLASMSHARPACLYSKGGIGVLGGLEEGFGACTSYAQWISGIESLKRFSANN
jgi:hypothetical protein